METSFLHLFLCDEEFSREKTTRVRIFLKCLMVGSIKLHGIRNQVGKFEDGFRAEFLFFQNIRFLVRSIPVNGFFENLQYDGEN